MKNKKQNKGEKMKRGSLGAIVLAIILILGVILVCKCTTKVPAGYVAVQYNMSGGIEGETLGQGWHVVSPTVRTTLYSIGLEQSYLTADKRGDSKTDESFKAPTADGKFLTVDLEFSYRFNQDEISDTFVRFKGKDGETVKETFIKPKIKAWTQEVTAKYPVTDVFGDKRQELNEALDVYLKEKFEPYGIIIDTVNFTDIRTDSETEAAIQQKVNAQQAQELAAIEAETARINAEKEKEVALIAAEQQKETAMIEAEQTKIKAEASAEATRIKAEAEADAVKVVSEAMTEDYISYTEAKNWNGQLPTVQGSGATIVDIGETNKNQNKE